MPSDHEVIIAFQKGVIFALKSKESTRRIEEILSETPYPCSKSQINNHIKKMDEDAEYQWKFKSENKGRSSIFQENQVQNIENVIKDDRKISAVDIFKNKNLNPDEATLQTVRNVIRRTGLKARKKRNTFFMTDFHIKQRKKWADIYVKKPPKFWETVIWSDESKMFSQENGNRYIRKYEDEVWDDPRFLTQKQQFHGGLEIMVWGCITERGPRHLVWLEGRQNSEKYCNMLEEELFTHQDFNKRLKFQQDNCSIHKSKKTTKFLKNKQIKMLPWFTKGCDLSPIEKVWSQMKHYLYLNKEKIKKREHVWGYCVKYWQSEECDQMIKKCLGSVHKNVKTLQELRGQRLKI